MENEGFGGAVGRHVGRGLEGGGGGDVDDGASALFEGGEENAGEVEDSADVEVEHREVVGEVGRGVVAVGAETAVVDEEDFSVCGEGQRGMGKR